MGRRGIVRSRAIRSDSVTFALDTAVALVAVAFAAGCFFYLRLVDRSIRVVLEGESAIESLRFAANLTSGVKLALFALVPAVGIAAVVTTARSRLKVSARRTERLLAEEELRHERDKFLSSVSHEIRTPLTAVLGFIEVLRDDEGGMLDSERSEMMKIAAAEAGDLTNMVEDLLVFARADADSLTVAQVSRLQYSRSLARPSRAFAWARLRSAS